jgi:hypothetical protein
VRWRRLPQRGKELVVHAGADRVIAAECVGHVARDALRGEPCGGSAIGRAADAVGNEHHCTESAPAPGQRGRIGQARGVDHDLWIDPGEEEVILILRAAKARVRDAEQV